MVGKRFSLAALFIYCLSSGISYAQHKVTITRVESLRPVPSGKVHRNELDPIPGTSVIASNEMSPIRVRFVDRIPQKSRRIPIPSQNPLGVSFCVMDIYPFEE